MKSFDFPEANHALAKDQPEYNTLYVFADGSRPELPMYMCFDLTDEQIEDIVKKRKLFYSQYTFGQPFQPMLIMTKNPFTNPIENFPPPVDDNRMTAELWDETHFVEDKNDKAIDVVAGGITLQQVCKNCKKKWEQHFFSTRQCELEIKTNTDPETII